MKLTTKSENALLALVYLARHGNNDFLKIEQICTKYGISKKYLEQIIMSLKQARYIKTKTGANGGYKLAVSAQKISVAAVMRLMDGALAPSLAVSKYFYSRMPISKEKKIMNVLKEIRDYVSNKVERLKISDLV